MFVVVFQVKPLIVPTQELLNTAVKYKWHQFDSRSEAQNTPPTHPCPSNDRNSKQRVGIGVLDTHDLCVCTSVSLPFFIRSFFPLLLYRELSRSGFVVESSGAGQIPKPCCPLETTNSQLTTRNILCLLSYYYHSTRSLALC